MEIMINTRRISVLVYDGNATFRYPIVSPAQNWDMLSSLMRGDVIRIKNLGILSVEHVHAHQLKGTRIYGTEDVLLISCMFRVKDLTFIMRQEGTVRQ